MQEGKLSCRRESVLSRLSRTDPSVDHMRATQASSVEPLLPVWLRAPRGLPYPGEVALVPIQVGTYALELDKMLEAVGTSAHALLVQSPAIAIRRDSAGQRMVTLPLWPTPGMVRKQLRCRVGAEFAYWIGRGRCSDAAMTCPYGGAVPWRRPCSSMFILTSPSAKPFHARPNEGVGEEG